MIACDSQVLCLNLYLAKKNEQERKALLRFLPEKMAKVLEKGEPIAHPPPFPTFKDYIPLIHPDWLAPFLESYSDRDRMLLISCLAPEQQGPLASLYDLEPPAQEPPPILRRFLMAKWQSWLFPNSLKLLIPAALPSHPLINLLKLPTEQIKQLILYLGLHDLAPELKKIIEAKLLKDIELALSSSEKDYLKRALKNPAAIQFAPLKLNHWDRTRATLAEVIQSRGLNRIAKALFGAEPSFLWYWMHRLSKKEAAVLQKLSIDLKNPKAHKNLLEEVAQTTHFIVEGSL